jgi:hypothetical protein
MIIILILPTQYENMEEKKHYEIKLVIEEDRYNNLLEICKRYKDQHDKDITPREYILMLIDSAINK